MNQKRERELSVVILAAGQGKRMKSPLAKVLHEIGGKPMLSHVIAKAKALDPSQILIVYGHAGEQLISYYSNEKLVWVEQLEQKGTGDAVAKAMAKVPQDHRVLVLYGDVPLIDVKTLENLIHSTPSEGVGIVTASVDEPQGLGRIVRDQAGKVSCIVEEKDATEKERAIKEINSGIGLYEAAHLLKWLPALNNDNVQGEFYLTDVLESAVKEKKEVYTCSPRRAQEVAGINDRVQQAAVERDYQRQQCETLMQQGTQIADPNRVDIRGDLEVGKEVFIDVNVLFEGKNTLHQGVRIGANCVLINSEIEEGAQIMPFSHIENAKIGKGATVGPFARVRPGTVLSKDAHIGTFVEIKNSQVGERSKINHLSYIGDAQIGKDVNIGAGCITCNYDGANKHQTIIEDNVHIGSDTQLVAPVKVGQGATVGAGSTLTKDAPAEQLTLTHQLTPRSQDWQRPKKSEDKK
jgi:bifunctional UDP-N-acetylglucosamine pyrophosphorylase/glucosamine-1-phosphate N-acetyltransferase